MQNLDMDCQKAVFYALPVHIMANPDIPHFHAVQEDMGVDAF